MVEPDIEPTLLSVFIAEAYFLHLPTKEVPSSRLLRLRFLQELLAPYERDAVLEQCGISKISGPSQKVDNRVIVPQSTEQIPTSDESLPNLEKFDMVALRTIYCEEISKPSDVRCQPIRCLRILQYVNEIGSPKILDKLRLSLTNRPEQAPQTQEPVIIDKLFDIHIYLDRQESQSHILVARMRYNKYMYYETYERAVRELEGDKSNGRREKLKVTARKASKSYEQGWRADVPATPHADSINHSYQILTSAEKNGHASSMVKDKIARKVAKKYDKDEKQVRNDIRKYIKEGRIMHLILHGRVCLNAALLVLFPSVESDPPSLDLEKFRPEIQEKELKTLRKPIGMKE
jgi:hypothetical protein